MKKTVAILLLLALSSPAVAQMREGGWFDAADANHDGVVTRGEFHSWRLQMFGRLDRNGDGVVSPADFPRLVSARPELYRRLTQALEGADSNNDGVVSRDELAKAPMRLFDRADANHDGQVTAAEAQTARNTVQGMLQSHNRP